MRKVEFGPEARADLFELYETIFADGGAARAGAYVARIEQAILALAQFPLSGAAWENGLRRSGFERRVSIIYRAADERIVIIRILYAGRIR